MKLPLLIIVFSCLLLSCGNEEMEVYKTAPQNKYILCRGSELYLNDGKKWKTNFETTRGINQMISHVNDFTLPADTTAYHTLANVLIEDYVYMINYCAYMGQSHELVHAYLFPLQELIVPMQVGGEITCVNQYDKIKKHLETYHEYFE
ncbi:MAG: hypothetical protein IPI31_13050 [Bacteroidetes bacterium]|nr:hypothetical protein [Bacteroidota bacterium]